MNKKIYALIPAAVAGFLTVVDCAFAQGTAFTYQGRLGSGGVPANGNYDMAFSLFAGSAGGAAIGGPVTNAAVGVTNGLFTTMVDFGNVFSGGSNWLQIAVSSNGVNAFMTLTPRQQLTPTPYAIFAESVNAANLVGAVPPANLSGVALLSGGNVFTGVTNSFLGKVGIGTANPLTELANTSSNILGSDGFGLGTGSLGWFNTDPFLEIGYTAGFFNPGSFVGSDGVVIGIAGTSARVLELLSATNNSLMVVNGNGHVGIGTNNPSYPLHVVGPPFVAKFENTNGAFEVDGFDPFAGTTLVGEFTGKNNLAPQLRFAGPGGGSSIIDIGMNSNADFVVEGNDAARMVVQNGGNVGIGTTTPAKKLDVTGTATSVAGGSSVESSVFMRVNNTQNDGTVSISDCAGIGFGRDSTRQAIVGGTFGNDYLDFYTGGSLTTPKMRIDFNGNVGIGTTAPTKGALEVDASNGVVPSYDPAAWMDTNGTHTGFSTGGAGVSIWAAGVIFGSQFFAFSDERIKNVIGQSDGAADLKTLLGIKITDYTYKDTVARGNRPQKKAIAQQVEQAYPLAVSKGVGEVPDIYKQAPVKDGWIQLATDLKVGERVKLIGAAEKGVYPVLEVKDGAFRTDFKTQEGKVFVFGREVSDFRSVDYEAIAMLNVSATQELARKVEAETSEVAALKQELAEMKKLVTQLAQDGKSARLAAASSLEH